MFRTSKYSTHLLVMLFAFLFFSAATQAQTHKIVARDVQLDEEEQLHEWFKAYRLLRIDKMHTGAVLGDSSEHLSILWDIEGFRPFETDLTVEHLLASTYRREAPIRCFYGTRMGGGMVSLTVSERLLYGFWDEADIRWRIEPLRHIIKGVSNELYILYRTDDYIEESNKRCGVSIQIKAEDQIRNRVFQVNQCYIEEMAIASTHDMVVQYGTVQDVEDHNIAVMNDVQRNYRHEFDDNIEFKIVTQFTPATAADDPWTSSTNASTLLADFRAWGNAGGFGSVAYDIAQMWTYRDLDGSTVGIAYLSTVCTASRYHLCQDYTNNSERLRVLTAHEIGHNHSANHDASGSTYIMAPSVTITDNWSNASRSAISSHVNSRTCLADCSTEGSPIADFTASTQIVCAGSSIDFKDFSQYGATRNWSFPGASPSASTVAKPTVSYNTVGNYDVQISSNNGSLSDTKTVTEFVKVSNPPAAPSCSPSGTAGAGGLRFFSIHKLSNSSGTAAIYTDASCDQVANLEPNTRYGVSFTAGNCNTSLFEQFKLWIDYNNNGIFEASEFACQSNALWCGGPIDSLNDAGLKFTTPSSMTEDVVLRMRAIVDDGGVSDACHNPSSGEVEDYGAAFASAPLPVTLLYFEVKKQHGSARLDWATASEYNSERFEILHGTDGSNFESIYQIPATGNSGSTLHYHFVHTTPASGDNYYLLKMVDKDGQWSYAPIRKLNYKPPVDLFVFPNPSSDELKIQYSEGQSYDVMLYDLSGKLIFEQKAVYSQLQLDLTALKLSHGVYLLKIQSPQGIRTQMIQYIGE